MSYEAWPSPDSRRGPLPRIEDLPIAEHGYDQEAVRRAFDDFYRHAAQLDASLKTLEAVEAFQRDAAELRNDLRSLRALGLGGAEPSWAQSSWSYERSPRELPLTALRLAGEAGLIVAIAVIAGVSHLEGWVIVALMAAALAVVWLCELLAARARTRVPASLYEGIGYAEVVSDESAGEPAPYVEAAALEGPVGWSAFEVTAEEEEDALTVIEEPLEDTEEDAEPDEEVDVPEDAAKASEPAGAESEAGRARWLRRRRAKTEQADDVAQQSQSPSHVRVLTPDGDDEPWERGFDGEQD